MFGNRIPDGGSLWRIIRSKDYDKTLGTIHVRAYKPMSDGILSTDDARHISAADSLKRFADQQEKKGQPRPEKVVEIKVVFLSSIRLVPVRK